MKQDICFRRFGTMIDCSRNAVMSVKGVKKWIDLTADMGYNVLLLYTEDTYEVDENPYFGYRRGRYSQDEIREIDQYALSKGVELVPCIQTLAHLNAIVRWPAYKEMVDINDILLAGDEKVYELIDKMFSSISKCFSSRTINIGMDEARMIGRGKYYDLHGDSNRSQLLIDHVKRVSEIGKKYGFTLEMWSDMFFCLAAGSYYNPSATINLSIQKQIPDNVNLVYWDYYSTDKNRYDKMLDAHQKIKENTAFAGGFWTWEGLAPHNGYSIKSTEVAVKSCIEHRVDNVIFTMWGDDGGECSRFAMIPSLFYASEIAKGDYDENLIKERFFEKFKITFDDFMLLDLPSTPGGADDKVCNPEKYLLYNDCFNGIMNSTIAGGENIQYAECGKKLAQIESDEQWGYLFATERALCDVLATKAELSVKTREVYQNRDQEALQELIREYESLFVKIDIFYRAYKKQWYEENKPHGFDVQDMRIGALLMRMRSCKERLAELYSGTISVIEELEEPLLDFQGNGECFGKEPVLYNCWGNIMTANIVTWLNEMG